MPREPFSMFPKGEEPWATGLCVGLFFAPVIGALAARGSIPRLLLGMVIGFLVPYLLIPGICWLWTSLHAGHEESSE